MKLAPLEGKIGYNRQLQQVPLTDVDTVQAIATIVYALREAKVEIVIGIDELDKISSDEEAAEFLNAMKILFPIDGCSFITSVSKNVWVRFEQRGRPFRDVFDSSFDEVVYVDMLAAQECRDLLRSREARLTDLQCLFCYVVSGGLPRELLRAARRLVQVASRQQDRALLAVINQVLSEDLEDKVRTTRTRLAQVVPPQHRSVYLAATGSTQTFPADGAAGSPSDHLEQVAHDRSIERPEWRDVADIVLNDLRVYRSFLGAIGDVFAASGPISCLDDSQGFKNDLVTLVCTPLAQARSLMASDATSAERVIQQVRDAVKRLIRENTI